MERRKIAQDVLKAVSRIKGRQASSRAMRTRESYVTWCCQLGSNSETTHGNTPGSTSGRRGPGSVALVLPKSTSFCGVSLGRRPCWLVYSRLELIFRPNLAPSLNMILSTFQKYFHPLPFSPPSLQSQIDPRILLSSTMIGWAGSVVALLQS